MDITRGESCRKKIMMASWELDMLFGYREWTPKIPYIDLPSGYMFKPFPNVMGSLARFHVTKKDSDVELSVYLDCFDILGNVGQPYWEVYPIKGIEEGSDWPMRSYLNETKGLIEVIKFGFGD